jgi:hypothetical protein
MKKQTHNPAQTAGLDPKFLQSRVGGHDRGFAMFPAHLAARIVNFDMLVMDTEYNVANWTETKENSGTIAYGTTGLLFTTGSGDGNSCNIQHKRAYTPASLKDIACAFRFTALDVLNTGLVFGMYTSDSDYFATEPIHQMVLYSAKASAGILGRTKDGTTGSNTAALATLEDDVVYDAYCFYDGEAGTLEFGIKEATERWEEVPTQIARKTTNKPTGAMHFSIDIENGEAAVNTLTVLRAALAVEI